MGVCPEFARIRPQFDIHLFDTLPSTNTQVWQMLGAGAKAGCVAIAHRQTAGRGQRGRSWKSAVGGLYLSLALEPDWPVAYGAQLTCLSAWGIAIALNNIGIAVKIKWPNDLYFEGKKLGGILTETKLSQSPPFREGSDWDSTLIKQAVIGVGLNWHNVVPETGVSLLTILKRISPRVDKNKINCLEVLIAIVLRGILQGYIFQRQVGNQDFMKAYEKLLTQVGCTVSLDSRGRLSLAEPVGLSHGLSHSLSRRDSKSACPRVTTRVLKDASPGDSVKGSRQWANRSGKVVGITEEGYLQVALHPLPFDKKNGSTAHIPTAHIPSDNILLFRPSEIHIS
ncbi:MAG: biotin--[acetyl-CoA-carboxylase] ligase [Cyanobacteria bacterium P01_D01_bin.36]